MRSQIKLGRIGGILIGLHYSWFIIALLIMFSLADHFRHVTPAWSPEVGVDGRSDDRIAVLCYSLAARISALRGGEDARAASARDYSLRARWRITD